MTAERAGNLSASDGKPVRGAEEVAGEIGFPWPLVVASLAAMATLALTARSYEGLSVLGALLVLSRVLPVRLPRSRIFVWMLRALLLSAVVTLDGLPPRNELTFWYFQPEYTNLIGYLLAAELTLRAWDTPPRSLVRAKEARGLSLLVSALVMAAASNTPQRWFIQWLAPLWLAASVLTARSFTSIGRPRRRSAVDAGRTRRLAGWPLLVLRTAALSVALSIGASSVFAITRYDQQLSTWAMDMLQPRGTRPAAQIGFSTDPHLGNVFNPTESADRVLLINGRLPEPHLRLLAFDTYRNGSWRPTLDDPARFFTATDVLHTPNTPAPDDSATRGPLRRLTFTRMDDTAGLLPVPLAVKGLTFDLGIREDASAALMSSDVFTLSPYQVTVSVDPREQGPLCTKPTPSQTRQLLTLPPELDPRVATLAWKLAGTAGSTIARLTRLEQALRSAHGYSLTYEPQGEPASDFILNGRAAHCEYFATAMVLMSRAIGVPARFVSGFYAHEIYGLHSTVVRQRDAHAWAECFVDGAGWLTLDATPSDGRPDHLFPDPPRWRRLWERATDLPGTLRDLLSSIGDFLGVPTTLSLTAVLALWLGVRAWLQRRRRDRLPGLDALSPELARLALRFEAWLRRARATPAAALTWRERLGAASLVGADANTPAVQSFLRAYDRARFAPADPAALSAASQALDALTRPGTAAGRVGSATAVPMRPPD